MTDLGEILPIAIGVGITVVFIVVFVVMFRMIRSTNDAFLNKAIFRQAVMPGAMVQVPFTFMPGHPHALWLDCGLSSEHDDSLKFEVTIGVRLGNAVLLDNTYRCWVDGEGDVCGLESKGSGTTALNSSYACGLGSARMKSVLRLFRFDAPPTPMPAELRFRFFSQTVTAQPLTLLVTVGDSPF